MAGIRPTFGRNSGRVWSNPGRMRTCSGHTWPHSGQFWTIPGQTGPKPGQCWRIRTIARSVPGELGPNLGEFGAKCGGNPASSGQVRAKFGRIWPRSGPSWSIPGQIWPHVAVLGQMNSGQFWTGLPQTCLEKGCLDGGGSPGADICRICCVRRDFRSRAGVASSSQSAPDPRRFSGERRMAAPRTLNRQKDAGQQPSPILIR